MDPEAVTPRKYEAAGSREEWEQGRGRVRSRLFPPPRALTNWSARRRVTGRAKGRWPS